MRAVRIRLNLAERFEDFFHILGGDADAIVLDLDAYRFVRLRSSRDDRPAAVDLGLDLNVVIIADGDNFGPLEYDIGVAQIDMAGFFLTPGDNPICAPDDGGSALPLIAVGPSANRRSCCIRPCHPAPKGAPAGTRGSCSRHSDRPRRYRRRGVCRQKLRRRRGSDRVARYEHRRAELVVSAILYVSVRSVSATEGPGMTGCE